MRGSRVGPWLLAGIPAGALVSAAALNAASGRGATLATVTSWILATFASIGIGLLLATRRRENPIGWVLLANGAVLATITFAESYSSYAVFGHPGALPGGAWAVLVASNTWPLMFAPITAVAWLFPDGRLPSPRWRPYAAAGAAAFALVTVLGLPAAFEGEFARVSNPLPRLPEALAVLRTVAAFAALGAVVGGVVAVVRRYRRTTGGEHLQLKWLAYAAALIPCAVAVCVTEIALTGDDGPATNVALVVALCAVPLAVGVAAMRYRLYEIDRLINRTLVYAALSAGLAGVFAAVSLVLGMTVGGGSTLPTAAATLAVAVLFGPLRARAQLLVDRRFDRARYEGLREVERFLEQLRTGGAAPEATGAVLATALGDPGLELRFRMPDGEHVDASGRSAPVPMDPERNLTPVRRGPLLLATVVHDRALSQRPDLLDSVIGAAGMAIEIARLRVEVRRQLAEVEASRARLVAVGYEERRRLERDLHDGAQQRLVSVGLALRHLERRLPAHDAAELDAGVGEIARAIDELRELARGVRPAGLDDGLARALGELASRSRLRTRVEVTDERFADRVETAAYFVASEALANATKYAGAASVSVSAVRRNGSLVVSVRDDGVGGAAPSEGSGLAGMTDRVAALGGRVSVTSPPGEGTVVTAELPCAS